MMSMRGNNIHFARATVHHDFIPGHHLQGFHVSAQQPQRGIFGTPFRKEMRFTGSCELRTSRKTLDNQPETPGACTAVRASSSRSVYSEDDAACSLNYSSMVSARKAIPTAEVRRRRLCHGPLYQIMHSDRRTGRAMHKELVSRKMTNCF